MRDYHVYGAVAGTKYLGKFRANSKEEAIEASGQSGAAFASFCHKCSCECEDPEIHTMTAEPA